MAALFTINSVMMTEAARQSIGYEVARPSRNLRPLGQRDGFIANCQKFVAAAISGLLSAGSPAHISRLVPLVIVNAVNAVLVAWALAHRGIKSIGGVVPFTMKRYSSRAVIKICRVIWVRASLDYLCMCAINIRAAKPMRGTDSLHYFLLNAAAALRRLFCGCQVGRPNRSLITAGAMAIPIDTSAPSVEGCNSKPSEYASGQIRELAHFGNSVMLKNHSIQQRGGYGKLN